MYTTFMYNNHFFFLFTKLCLFSGIIEKIEPLNIGKACWLLGGGRRTKINLPIDYSTGVIFLKTVGSNIDNNEPWIQIHHSTQILPKEIKDLIEKRLKCYN